MNNNKVKFADYCQGLLLAAALALPFASPAKADRCANPDGQGMVCDHNYKVQWYSCNGAPLGRAVRWQVPEGSPPPGGWPVAFFYNGTSPADTNPFLPQLGGLFGGEYAPEIIHELLDDPMGSGRRYAVVAPEPPQSAVVLEYWNTNLPVPYSSTCDFDFFPKLFSEIKRGKYGSASQYDMESRYAYGISSGGYNTSRMAVSFNDRKLWYQSCDEWCNEDTWKALAIIAGSYASCGGSLCPVPNLNSDHPPTKFWHGVLDLIVPRFTVDNYIEELDEANVRFELQTHNGGHAMSSENLGQTGVKAWFDLHP